MYADKISLKDKIFKTTTGLYVRNKEEYYDKLKILRETENWKNSKLICDTFLWLK